MPSPIVFVGPSLRPPLPDTTGVELRRPAARGDLLSAVTAGARVIGLIDGVFHQAQAVTPAEVREAARKGAQLFGGASIGALRACECPQDMHGVGAIWDAFARGELTDDDEVAVTFLPGTYEVVAFPLVQVREVARLAVLAYPSCGGVARGLVEAVRGLPFQERTLDAVRVAAAPLIAAGVSWAEMERWLTSAEFDVKRRDAIAVLEAVKQAGGLR